LETSTFPHFSKNGKMVDNHAKGADVGALLRGALNVAGIVARAFKGTRPHHSSRAAQESTEHAERGEAEALRGGEQSESDSESRSGEYGSKEEALCAPERAEAVVGSTGAQEEQQGTEEGLGEPEHDDDRAQRDCQRLLIDFDNWQFPYCR